MLLLNDKSSKKLRYVSDAVVIAALEKHISCEPIDISDLRLETSRIGSDEYLKSVARCIREEGADAVICTSLKGLRLISEAKKKENLQILTCGIISDYSILPAPHDLDADCIFVPHEEIKARLVQKGLDSQRIFVTGIPVKKSFREHIGKAAARNYLVIPKNKRVYLLIPDGLEAADITRLCEELSRTEREEYLLYIPTPRCSVIRDKLMDYAEGSSNVRIITYTRRLNLYIESADAMLLKPDSLTSTEAAVSGVPIVHLFLNADNKNGSGDFFANHEMAVIGRNICDTVKKAKCFAEQKAMAARVIQMQYRNICADSADKMIEIIMKMRARTADMN